jgi:hypothetical protein
MVASNIGVIMHGVMGNDDRNKCWTDIFYWQAFKFGYAQQQSLADPKFELSVFNSTVKMLR